MIVKKDGLRFYTDKKGNPDILLYAPQNYMMIHDYIIANRVKKIALCGGGLPTQEYLNTINDFKWVEYINGYMKGLDFSFINQMPALKMYIGTVDYEINNNSVEELYIGSTPKTRISKLCSNLKILEIEGCKSVRKLFNNEYPPLLERVTFLKGTFESCAEFMPNTSIEDLSFINCSKLKNLENLGSFGRLRKIRLENCKNVSDIDEISLIPSLNELDIVNCPKIDIHKKNYSSNLKIFNY